ncbi:MFS transporter [Streptomyces sp. AV19]|uniref:MFS transporter n=1 Tax=Streptomyces sp. AV19 TaxID=2793068 RepID=UPI0018FE5E6A|nr:MFS transporter [Streptomyces sp. AV19]MBH1937092.1 MFS transporter [Streptomyces sp. AV19]MDG4533118.1 MFS transporter [Streptomyces sp. AV19]
MSTDRASLAGPREWIGLAALTCPALLIGLDFTVLHLVLPRLSAELHPSSVQMLWIVDIYGFVIAGMLIPMGALGDRIGRRRLLSIGSVLFALASLLTAYATSPAMVIAARALLGLTGATLLPSTLALVTNMFRDDKQRRLAIAVWSTALSVGNAVGPVVGGAMLERFWWGSVFLLALPVMVALLVLSPLVVPEYRDAEATARIDMTSVGMLMASLITVVYGIKQFAKDGLGPVPVVAVVVGAVIGVFFVRRQRRLPDPLLDLALFAHRRFSVSIGAQMLAMVALAAFQFFLMQYLQLVEDLSPLTAGLWTVPGMVAGVVGALLGPAFTRAFTPGQVISGGLAVAAAGLVGAVWAAHSLVPIVVAFIVTNLAINIVWALSYDQILGAAPPERAGTASGAAETGNELGLALGVALSGSLAAAVYHASVSGSLPSALSPHDADTAGDNLAGAVSVAERVPAAVADRVLDVTRDAFTDGMQLASGVLAALMAAMAVAVGLLLRDRPAAPAVTAVQGDTAPEQPAR